MRSLSRSVLFTLGMVLGLGLPMIPTPTLAGAAAVRPLGPPTKVAAVAGNSAATVSWTAPTSTGGSALSSYTATSIPGSKTCTVAAPATSCVVSGLDNGIAYTFTVNVTNAANASATSAASTKSVTPGGAPGYATGIIATTGDGSATVSWTAAPSNGGGAVTYVVTLTAENPPPVAKVPKACTTATTSCTFTGMTNGQNYYATVTAKTSKGQTTTDPTDPFTPSAIPGTPEKPIAVAGYRRAFISGIGAASNGAPIDSYVVTSSPGNLTCTIPGWTNTCIVEGLTAGVSYTFTVRAHNQRGSSAQSSAASNAIVPTNTAPPASTELGAATSLTVVGWGGTMCGIVDGGKVRCWGTNAKGELGISQFALSASTLALQVPGITTAVALAGSRGNSLTDNRQVCALLADATVWCWGSNYFTWQGSGSQQVQVWAPQKVQGLSDVRSINGDRPTNNGEVCAITNGGGLYCWTTATNLTQVPVTGHVVAGTHDFAVLDDGSVVSTADGSKTTYVSRDGLSSGEMSGVVEVRQGTWGSSVACALKGSGEVWCRGASGLGIVPTDSSSGWGGINQSKWQRVRGVSGATAISVGDDIACAVLSDRSAMCWGFYASELLPRSATGEMLNTSGSAQPWTIIPDMRSLALKDGFLCAANTTGTYCLGYTYGTLGPLGDGIDRPANWFQWVITPSAVRAKV